MGNGGFVCFLGYLVSRFLHTNMNWSDHLKFRTGVEKGFECIKLTLMF